MVDISTERVPIVGKKGKSTGYYYKEVTANKRAPGASEKELGACWGRDSGKADEEGRVTRVMDMVIFRMIFFELLVFFTFTLLTLHFVH